MKTLTVFTLLCWSIGAFAQNLDTLPQTEATQTVQDTEKTDFPTTYQLKGKKPIMARITEDFELRTAPECTSEKTGTVIPRDSIAFIYKYFPKEKCWATQYHNQWGFVSDSKVFPVSARSVAANRYDKPPQLKSGIHPVYPKEAKKKGVKGRVYIKVYIDKNGKATRTLVLKGFPELNQAAIDAVKKAKFKPATRKNKKVGVWVTLSLNFK